MIVDFEQLQKLSGMNRPSAVRRWLQHNGVAYLVQASGNPVTTEDAINRAMIGSSKYNAPDLSPSPFMRKNQGKKAAPNTDPTPLKGPNNKNASINRN